MCTGHGYRNWYEKQIQNHLPKTKIQRMNYVYSILRARRAIMSNNDPLKDGIMLQRCRTLERKIQSHD